MDRAVNERLEASICKAGLKSLQGWGLKSHLSFCKEDNDKVSRLDSRPALHMASQYRTSTARRASVLKALRRLHV